MTGSVAPNMGIPSPAVRRLIGRVNSVSGSQASISLAEIPTDSDDDRATVGKFVGILCGRALIIGLVSEVNEALTQPVQAERVSRSVARVELIGEIGDAAGSVRFQRGINTYPRIGDEAVLMSERQLRAIYGSADSDRAQIGDLQQNTNVGIHINIDDLVSRHFAVLGTTGVGNRAAWS